MSKFMLVIAALAGSSAFGSGFEKAIMFGGRAAGIGGIATPYIQGPQSLYFNPAASPRIKKDMRSMWISPRFSLNTKVRSTTRTPRSSQKRS